MSDNGNIKTPKLDELITKELLTKSNNINKITDNIYLGDEEGAKEIDFFKAEQIQNVLSITDNPPTYPPELNIIHKIINLDENKSLKIFSYLKECIDFIDNCDKIYIHCSCGISRSPSIVIAYLMWKTHSSFSQAYNYVQKRRNCIEPNIGFLAKLQKFDTILKNNDYNIKKIDFKSINVK